MVKFQILQWFLFRWECTWPQDRKYKLWSCYNILIALFDCYLECTILCCYRYFASRGGKETRMGSEIVCVVSPAFGGRGRGVWRTIKLKTSKDGMFDTTLGYPGEGWSAKNKFLSMTTWNTRNITFEWFQYCKTLKYDILAITELWRNQQKFLNKSMKFIASEPKLIKTGPRKGQVRFPQDRVAGVGILLSNVVHTGTSPRAPLVLHYSIGHNE